MLCTAILNGRANSIRSSPIQILASLLKCAWRCWNCVTMKLISKVFCGNRKRHSTTKHLTFQEVFITSWPKLILSIELIGLVLIPNISNCLLHLTIPAHFPFLSCAWFHSQQGRCCWLLHLLWFCEQWDISACTDLATITRRQVFFQKQNSTAWFVQDNGFLWKETPKSAPYTSVTFW